MLSRYYGFWGSEREELLSRSSYCWFDMNFLIAVCASYRAFYRRFRAGIAPSVATFGRVEFLAPLGGDVSLFVRYEIIASFMFGDFLYGDEFFQRIKFFVRIFIY